MSHRVNGIDGSPVAVETDGANRPLVVDGQSVLRRLAYHREWIGILTGEPQADVWRVETVAGICELHYHSFPQGNFHFPEENTDVSEEEDAESASGTWLLLRWED